MNYKFLPLFLLLQAPVCRAQDTTQGEAAEPASPLLRHLPTVVARQPWLSTSNSAALTRHDSTSIAQAELTLDWQRGGLTNFDGSSRCLQADVQVEAIQRLSRRSVVRGGIGYTNTSSRDVTGSAFLPTDQLRPFDIVEDSLTNAGNKHADRYHLFGSVGTDLWKGYSVGVGLDYTSANYAKYKDLRHKNKLMQLRFSLSAYAPVLPWLSVGAAYHYLRHTESLQFSTYGRSDKVYKSLIDYGTFFGRVEQFGNDGYTDKSREMPLFEDGHGISMQIGIDPLPELTITSQVQVARTTGYYGRPSPYTITYTHHQRHQASASLSALWRQTAENLYRLDFDYSYEDLSNQASTYRELIAPTGATYYAYYDAVETGDKWLRHADISATALLGLHGDVPLWHFSASYKWLRRTQQSYLYPYFRTQELQQRQAALHAVRSIFCNHGIWSLSADASFLWGSGTPYADGVFTTQSHLTSAEPPHPFLWREYQYLTAPQRILAAEVRYTFRPTFITESGRLATYVALRASHRKANQQQPYSTGSDRTSLCASIGCTF